ncbi:MAG: ATP-dependent Clp protease proteolytic subunit, partial [Rhodoferax sp.]|nr:ATP-dependent Clp protease proteolytic subunit [Rhodoferax sp.]
NKKLDLILHSPGGGIDAAAAMVYYLRSKFEDIRVVVPSLAMSAAAMIACSGNTILMGKHSFLGPADPQFILPTPLGARQVAAQSVVAQFKRAQKECIDDPRNLAVWAPILSQYGPDLLVQAEHATKLSKTYVETWLKTYMFGNDADRDQKAADISLWLSSHDNFNSHGTHIPREDLRNRGLVVLDMESNQEEQEIFLSIFHAMTHTMGATGAVKIIENHLGRSYINQVQMMMTGTPPNAGMPVQNFGVAIR